MFGKKFHSLFLFLSYQYQIQVAFMVFGCLLFFLLWVFSYCFWSLPQFFPFTFFLETFGSKNQKNYSFFSDMCFSGGGCCCPSSKKMFFLSENCWSNSFFFTTSSSSWVSFIFRCVQETFLDAAHTCVFSPPFLLPLYLFRWVGLEWKNFFEDHRIEFSNSSTFPSHFIGC